MRKVQDLRKRAEAKEKEKSKPKTQTPMETPTPQSETPLKTIFSPRWQKEQQESSRGPYFHDNRWKNNGFEINGTFFSNDSKKFSDWIDNSQKCRNWQGLPGEDSPQDFLESMVTTAFNEELTAKGLYKLILGNLSESLREVTQEHIRKTVHVDEMDAKILYLWDFLWTLHGKAEEISELAFEKLKQRNLTFASYVEIWEEFVRKMKEIKNISETDLQRYQEFFERGLSLVYRQKRELYVEMHPSANFEMVKTRMIEWENDYCQKNRGYLPSGVYIGQEKLLKENARLMALGKKLRHEDVRDLSLVNSEDVDARYELFIANPFKSARSCKEA